MKKLFLCFLMAAIVFFPDLARSDTIEAYDEISGGYILVEDNTLSTFAIVEPTGSYWNIGYSTTTASIDDGFTWLETGLVIGNSKAVTFPAGSYPWDIVYVDYPFEEGNNYSVTVVKGTGFTPVGSVPSLGYSYTASTITGTFTDFTYEYDEGYKFSFTAPFDFTRVRVGFHGSLRSSASTLAEKITSFRVSEKSGSASDISGIFEYVREIFSKIADLPNSIKNSLSGLFQNVVNAVTSIPGMIIDGIKDLFIPSDDWFEESFEEWDTYFEERLGVLYMPVLVAESVIYPLFRGEPLGSAGGLPFDTSGAESLSSGQILFPALSLPIGGETYQIWEAQVIDFAGMLNTYGLAWILDALKIIIGYIFICRFCSAICVCMFTTYFKDDLFFLTLASWFDRISFKSDKIVF